MNAPRVKAVVLELLARERTAEHVFIASLSEVERGETGTFARWSAKDLIAHVAAWKSRHAQRLDAIVRGETPQRFGDFDALNARTYAEQRARPWADVLADADRAHRDLVLGVAAVTADDLASPERFAWLNGVPLWRRTLIGGYWHPLWHMAEFCRQRGARDAEAQLWNGVAEALAQVELPPALRAFTLYNLACGYAGSGQDAHALDALGEALRLDPSLREHARQDLDLQPLRAHAAYQALIAGNAQPDV
jgi:Protein of unknown function (DUF1706)